VDIVSIAPASLHWLAQLQQDICMGAATETTLSIHPDFDLATTLRHWLAKGVLIDFNTPLPSPLPQAGESWREGNFTMQNLKEQ